LLPVAEAVAPPRRIAESALSLLFQFSDPAVQIRKTRFQSFGLALQK